MSIPPAASSHNRSSARHEAHELLPIYVGVLIGLILYRCKNPQPLRPYVCTQPTMTIKIPFMAFFHNLWFLQPFCPLFHNDPCALGIYDLEVIDYPHLSNAHYTASKLITSAIIKFQIRYVLYLHPQAPIYPSSTSTHQHFLLEEDVQD